MGASLGDPCSDYSQRCRATRLLVALSLLELLQPVFFMLCGNTDTCRWVHGGGRGPDPPPPPPPPWICPWGACCSSGCQHLCLFECATQRVILWLRIIIWTHPVIPSPTTESHKAANFLTPLHARGQSNQGSVQGSMEAEKDNFRAGDPQ